VGAGPEPGAYDEARLLAELERLLSVCRDRGWNAAYGEALKRDFEAGRRDPPEKSAYGNCAAGLLSWITGHRQKPAAYEEAHELLHDAHDDPRREQVLELVHRIAAGTITWDELYRIEKQGLMRWERPLPPPPAADAVSLTDALATLEAMLDGEDVDIERPDPLAVWSAFSAFASRPVAAVPLHVDDDMCLFQWGVGVYDSRAGRCFQWDLTRQFVLNDGGGDYDHMEHLSLTLLFDPDPDLVGLGSGEVWSGGGLGHWLRSVPALDAFRAVNAKQPRGLRLQQFEV
jgi:hypothetical protein